MSRDPATKKNYLVKLEVSCNVLVIGAESEEQAHEYATDVASLGDCEVFGSEIEEVPDAYLDSERRHANAVSEDK
jgi:hypothetical protein